MTEIQGTIVIIISLCGALPCAVMAMVHGWKFEHYKSRQSQAEEDI